MKEFIGRQKDVALEEMTIPTARQAQEQAKAKTLEKHEQLCELSRALAVLASASVRTRNVCFLFYIFNCMSFTQTLLVCRYLFQSVSREREEFLRLVKEEVTITNLPRIINTSRF